MQRDIPNLALLSSDSKSGGRIGSILVEMGKITPADIDRIVRLQSERGIYFGEAAKVLALVSEADIVEAMSAQFGYCYLRGENEKFSRDLVMIYEPFEQSADAIRAVRGQLVAAHFRHGERNLSVIGAGGAETSAFAANLALGFAQLGKRTVLVDLNMHRSAQKHLFATGWHLGLSDLLAGRCWLDALLTFPEIDNFSVLSAGTPPPNPHELLASPRLAEAMQALHDRFDVVLFDIALKSGNATWLPLVPGVNAALLACVKHATLASDAIALRRHLDMQDIHILGSVLLERSAH